MLISQLLGFDIVFGAYSAPYAVFVYEFFHAFPVVPCFQGQICPSEAVVTCFVMR